MPRLLRRKRWTFSCFYTKAYLQLLQTETFPVSWSSFNQHHNDDGQWPNTLLYILLVWLGKADPTHQGRKHLVPLQIKPHVLIGLYALTWSAYQKRRSQTKCKLYLKDNSFCINISCISHQLSAKQFLFIRWFLYEPFKHLQFNERYNFLDSFSLTAIFKLVKRIIARFDLASSMHVENPHDVEVSCAASDTAV